MFYSRGFLRARGTLNSCKPPPRHPAAVFWINFLRSFVRDAVYTKRHARVNGFGTRTTSGEPDLLRVPEGTLQHVDLFSALVFALSSLSRRSFFFFTPGFRIFVPYHSARKCIVHGRQKRVRLI